MLRRKSSVGMNPRMAGILGTFQILWVIYGLSVGSRNVVIWSSIAIVINYLTVGAYFYFARVEERRLRLDDNPPGGEAGEIGHEELAAERTLTDIHRMIRLSGLVLPACAGIGKPGPSSLARSVFRPTLCRHPQQEIPLDIC